MAMFDFATDVKVEIAQPADNAFVIGLSLIGGTDVLDGNGFEYVDVTSLTSEINIQNSVVFEGPLGRPDEPQTFIRIKGNTYDPRVNKNIHPGIPVKISAKDASGTWQIVYHSRIRDISSNYNPAMRDLVEKNMVQFMLDSPYSIANQSAIPVTTFAFDQYATDRMQELVDLASVDNRYFPDFTIENPALTIIPDIEMLERETFGETFGPLFQECFDAIGGRGWLTIDFTSTNPNGVLVYKTNNAPAFGYFRHYIYLDNTNTNIQINNIDLSFDADQIYNVWNLQRADDTSGSYSYTYRDQDSIDLFGEKTFDIALWIAAIGLDWKLLWINASLELAAKDRIRNVSVSAINSNNMELNDVAFLKPGLDYAQLNFVDTNIEIDNSYLITRVNHNITPEFWETELELIGE
jgi:hypothetical protein